MKGLKPAFPATTPYTDPGMSLRDYFTATAMNGVIVSNWGVEFVAETLGMTVQEYADRACPFHLFAAEMAVKIADATIERLSRGGGET